MRNQSAPSGKVALVLVERFRHRHRPAGIGMLAANKLAGAGLGGPEIEHGVAAGVLEVVSGGKPLRPGAAPSIGAANQPRSGPEVAAIAQRDARRDRDEIGLAPDP